MVNKILLIIIDFKKKNYKTEQRFLFINQNIEKSWNFFDLRNKNYENVSSWQKQTSQKQKAKKKKTFLSSVLLSEKILER